MTPHHHTPVRHPVPGHLHAVPDGLVYVTDQVAGITRHRRGKGFCYRRVDGMALRNRKQIERIRGLAIPPAYTRVWICPDPYGHLQATGRDARGRKQYRYHPDWRRARDGDKFARMAEFGAALPRIRAKVTRDLRQDFAGRHLPRVLVSAALVRVLDTTLIRIGNEEYARTNGSYGLTTLRNRHAQLIGTRLHLRFRGKSGIAHQVLLDDARVARVVRACQAMPGQELFSYEDEVGRLRSIGSIDVNDYLRDASGAAFTAKDFRTWHASSYALALLTTAPHAGGPVRATRRQVNEVLEKVARRLGNTMAVCRKSYVHPALLSLASSGGLQECVAAHGRALAHLPRGLHPDERHLLAFLHGLTSTASGRRALSA